MTEPNTGGPAFPMNWVKQEAPNLNVILEQKGMTLRDYFAAKAMQTYMMSETWNPDTYKNAARSAYRVADEMLKARNEE